MIPREIPVTTNWARVAYRLLDASNFRIKVPSSQKTINVGIVIKTPSNNRYKTAGASTLNENAKGRAAIDTGANRKNDFVVGRR